jgi:hypothetical protein
MQNPESVATLARLGLMDPLAAIETIIAGMQPADLTSIRTKVNSIVEARATAIKRTVKRTRLKELEAWHLQCGDREMIAQSQSARWTWRIYEVKRAKDGVIKKGRMLRTLHAIDSLDDIVWGMATGQN